MTPGTEAPALLAVMRLERTATGILAFATDGSEREFDLVMADPPYGVKNLGQRSQSFAQQLLDDEFLPGLLASGGLLILGHARRDTLSLPATWEERKALKHGDSIFRVLQVANKVEASSVSTAPEAEDQSTENTNSR